MANTKHVTVDQSQQIITAFATKADERFLKQADVTQYTVKKQGTAETGYSATYQLYTVGTGAAGADEPVGDKINIPKDMVVESGSVVDITFNTSDSKLYDGAVDVTEIIKGAGGTATAADAGKYIKLVIANADEDKIYIKVTDLVDVYTGSNAIDITNNEISLIVDSTNANGLEVGNAGLKLNIADGLDLDASDNLEVKTGNGLGINSTSKAVEAVVDTNNANGLSSTADGLALAQAGASATGALTSTDWNTFNGKQDTLVEGDGIDVDADGVTVSVVIDSTNANGLSVGNDGVALATAGTSATGALTSTDWNTFNDKQATLVEGNGIDIAGDGVTVSVSVDSSSANGLSSGASGVALATAVPATSYVAATGTYVSGTTYYTDATGAATVDTSEFEPGVTDVSSYFVAQANTASNGAMTAADKQKLDGLGTASAADITAIINSIWAD